MNYAHARGANLRRHERADVGLSAAVTAGEETQPCRIMDISVGGSKIEAEHLIEKGASICLNIGGVDDVPGDVVWGRAPYYGLKFNGDPEHVAEAIMGLAAYT